MLTAAQVRAAFHYDPETGILTRVSSGYAPATGRWCGKRAGHAATNGYLRATCHGREYAVHRLAWIYMTGEWPDGYIDHGNGVRTDNRWANLRAGDRSFNMQNQRRARRDNTTGWLGVSRVKSRFEAAIQVRGRRFRLGRFDTPEAAHAAYLTAKRKLHEGCTL